MKIGGLWPGVRSGRLGSGGSQVFGAPLYAGLEFICYYLGPNSRHSLRSTIPGAVAAIAVWFLGSWGLSFYLEHLSNYNATYGSMGALIGLMLWFYITALALRMGAELNAEKAKYKAQNGQRAAFSDQRSGRR